jgi:hypothetical protein
MLSVCTSCRCLGNTRAYLDNVRALLHARCVIVFLYSRPTKGLGMRGDTKALPSREAESRAVGHMVAPEPSRAERGGGPDP